jgi:DNA-binding NarL/FixJ family response regulator
LLELSTDLWVVAEAHDGIEAVRQVERHKPDLLLLDLSMPGLSGLDVIREARRASARTRVLILSMHREHDFVARALREGAIGYALKDLDPDELIRAIREAAAGKRYVSPTFSVQKIEELIRGTGVATSDPYDLLTGREREVLHLVAEGSTSQQIADRLNIGRRTAETHRANVMRKLGARSQSELILFAMRRGLVE